MKKRKKTHRFLILLLGIFSVTFIVHRGLIMLEKHQLTPPGDMLAYGDSHVHVYASEPKEHTWVFLSSYGSASPYYEYYAMLEELKEVAQVVVIERIGQGYSQDSKDAKSLEDVVTMYKTVLSEVNEDNKVTLFVHGIAFFEAIYWAITYPEDIVEIVAFDPAMPSLFLSFEPNLLSYTAQQVFTYMGIRRLMPILLQHPILTQEALSKVHKQEARKLMHINAYSQGMKQELLSIQENATIAHAFEPLSIPVTLYTSNGRHTGFDENTWVNAQIAYAQSLPLGAIYHLDVPHMVHVYEYALLSRLIKESFEP